MKEIITLLSKVYNSTQIGLLEEEIENLLHKYVSIKNNGNSVLTEKDIVLITYGDQVFRKNEVKLKTLNKLILSELKEEISIVHILPFCPSSSDDGFSVVDYYEIDSNLGKWEDVEEIAKNYKLLFDAVINHSSKDCKWFEKFLNNEEQYKNYYLEIDNIALYSQVVRPRTTPLSHKYKSNNGTAKEVWTTFSEDQVDLNFKDPTVFLQIMDVLLFYISKGAKIIRLDAVGFLWKEKNSTSIHLPQTHILIKAMRKIIEELTPSVMLLSETNVPHLENISYFGKGDEAHMVYNFTLPPLLAYSILSGDTKKLAEWTKTLKLPYNNICFFNFLASHDGIGVRPVDNILKQSELKVLVNSTKANGGKVSYKLNSNGEKAPYELNCNYFSLLKGVEKNNELGIRRTLFAHAILLTMPGVPAIYFHSMFGSENDIDGMNQSGISRRINREKLEYENLTMKLKNSNSKEFKVLKELKKIIKIRKRETAFNPYSSFKVEEPYKGVFSLERTSIDAKNIIKTFFNLNSKKVIISLTYTEAKVDLLSGKLYKNILELEPLDFVWLRIK